MKHPISDIDNDETVAQEQAIASDKFMIHEFDTIDFKIDKFPREFKKNFFQTIDKTFLAFLLLSIFLNVGTILYLQDILPGKTETSEIIRLQENYAKLLLKNNPATPSYSFETGSSATKVDSKMITGLGKWMDVYTNHIIETIKNIPPIEPSFSKSSTKETSLPSHEQLAEGRKSAGVRRSAASQELEREVNSVGLLGLISRDAKATDQEYVDDLMEYASENSEQLSRVLSKLSKIEVPRYGSSGYLKRIRTTETTGDVAEARGGRVTTEAETKTVVENIAPLTEVKTTSIERNVHFEAVPSSDSDKLAETSKISRIRSAQDVLKIVRNHTRALQDCYKQELKYDPTIKGKITVRFIIDPDGVVTNASIVTSTLNSPRMEQCILTRVKGWRDFPPCDPETGEKTYRQSFSFGDNTL